MKEKKNVLKIIIISVICFVILGTAGYFIFQHFSRLNFRGEFPREFDFSNNSDRRGGMFQIDNQTQSDISSFFENSPSSSEVDEYCNANPMYCMYYCRDVNPEFEYCDNLEFNPGEKLQ